MLCDTTADERHARAVRRPERLLPPPGGVPPATCASAASRRLPVLARGGAVPAVRVRRGHRRVPAVAASPPRARQGHGQAALLVYSTHSHGHTERPRQTHHAQRNLPVHHGTISVLQREQAGLAELYPTQPFAKRVLRQSSPRRQETGEGQLLDVGPRLVQYVRQRLLPASPSPFQKERRRQRERGGAETAATGTATTATAQSRNAGASQVENRVQGAEARAAGAEHVQVPGR